MVICGDNIPYRYNKVFVIPGAVARVNHQTAKLVSFLTAGSVVMELTFLSSKEP